MLTSQTQKAERNTNFTRVAHLMKVLFMGQKCLVKTNLKVKKQIKTHDLNEI